MARESIHELRPRETKVNLSDRRNDLAETFWSEIERSLAEDILPESFGSEFTLEEAPLYVNNRKWQAGAVQPGNEFRYEQYLHRHYWPGLGDDCPLLILQGSEGLGKSTLLRFYFDCYLPHFDRFPYVNMEKWDRSEWDRQRESHVVLYVDLRPGSSTAGVEDRVLSAFRPQISKRFPGITVENDYAMWRRLVDWDDAVHRQAEKAFHDRSTYRANYVTGYLAGREIVEEALWYIGNQRDGHGKRKYYLTLILDNLDQQDRAVQRRVLQLILRWLGPSVYRAAYRTKNHAGTINLWKAIVPLRPETLRSLHQDIQPVDRRKILELGKVDEEFLLEARGDCLENDAKTTKRQVETEGFFGEEEIPMYVPLSNAEGALRLKQMLMYDFTSEDTVETWPLETKKVTQRLVEDFCNGSIRRFLRLRKRLAVSVPIERAISRRSRRRHPDALIPHYAFLDGWLTGGRDHFHEDDVDNDVLNLYSTTAQPACAYTLLIGPHVLYRLRKRKYWREELVATLTGIGYFQAEVEDCLNSMHERGLFKHGMISPSGDLAIDRSNKIIEAHRDLLESPAYTDNMAIVTPVEDDCSKEMEHTVSYEVREFVARVRTTFQFLEQIRSDEVTVSTWKEGSARHLMDEKEFTQVFNSLGIPSIYRKVAVEFRQRLIGLHDNPGRLKRVVEEDVWNDMLENDILRVDAREVHTPLKVQIEKTVPEPETPPKRRRSVR